MSSKSVLFVCLGNICRSPLAEGIFRKLVEERGLAEHFTIDSCGTGSWHVGEPPHPTIREVATESGVSLRGMRARKLDKSDFSSFDFLVAMDRENLSDITSGMRSSSARAFCLREYDEKSKDPDVPDPYYTGDFEGAFEIIERCCVKLLDDISADLS